MRRPQEFPSSENCLQGYAQYSFKRVDASHDITETLPNGKTVTQGIPVGDGRKEFTWKPDGFKTLAEGRVREYEEGDRYKPYAGYTR